MSARHLAMLLALGAIWGATYLFNEIALDDLEPAAVIEGRFLFALALLLPVVALTGARSTTLAAIRAAPLRLAAVAVLNGAAPFFLITWGQTSIDSGLAGVLLASSPLFTALAAWGYDRAERVSGLRLLGVLVGFVGVAVLLGVQPAGGRDAVTGALAVVAAAALYAIAGLYVGRSLRGVPGLAIATGTVVWGAAVMLPLAILDAPGALPGADSVASVAALGLGATGVGYLLYFALIRGAGASRAILVNYLIPTIAVAYGVLLLDEALTTSTVVGLALILAGVSLGAGVVGPGRRRA